MKDRRAVPLHLLRRNWKPEELGFLTTEELPDPGGLVGQERAVASLQFGLSITSPGYNIYVAGPAGTGKTSYTRSLVQARAESEPPANDWVYVNNFDRSDEPAALALPPGGAREFARDIDELIADARRATGSALDAKEHQQKREDVVRRYRMEIASVMDELRDSARDAGFLLSQSERGLMPVPMLQGQPMTEEQYEELPEDSKRAISDRGRQVQELIAAAGQRTWELERALRDEIRSLDSQVAGGALSVVVGRMKARYKHLSAVVRWLSQVERELVGMTVKETVGTKAMEQAAVAQMEGAAERQPPRAESYARFKVNVFVHHLKKSGAPVVFETNPTFHNLFGKAEVAAMPDGAMVTGVMNLKAGALQRANGGYLILQAADVLRSLAAWEFLKRALNTGEVRIESLEQESRLFPMQTIRPQPIPLRVKVILLGGAGLYRMLFAQDEGFRKQFKIKAEFDTTMEASETNVRQYAEFVARICRKEGLCHFTAGAVAQVLEHSHRLAEDQTKLSARFNEVVELIYEANAWAIHEGHSLVDARHVNKAIAEKGERAALPEMKLQEHIHRGTILVNVADVAVGEVNGLTVMNLGDHSFGSPSRITARVYTGQEGILHIERQINMTGQIHDKGLFTLSGYLGERFAQNKPLAISASIAFEQTYVPVDGDSASSTELYALLSALSDIPIDQGIAVTGSVNQRGEVQPIGGVNEKIEGFYKVCKIIGLTGLQGVMIPSRNLPNLMLSEEVVDAVRDGKFHVWSVNTIEEGIELLTGLAAGDRDAEGRYPPGTLFERVDRRVEALVRNLFAWKRQY